MGHFKLSSVVVIIGEILINSKTVLYTAEFNT